MDTRQSIKARLQELASALVARDLRVGVDGRKAILTATNPVASDTEDPRGRAMNPGLSQKIALCLHEDDTLHFY
ncbi:MAG: hypothetical protein ACJ72W_09315 [Actinoallomurus sp.]